MMTTMTHTLLIGSALVLFINIMGKHRNRTQRIEIFHTNELELDKDKFVLVHEKEGQYCILNITGDNKIMIRRLKHKDDNVARERITELLELLQK
jgi:hypothetical protein